MFRIFLSSLVLLASLPAFGELMSTTDLDTARDNDAVLLSRSKICHTPLSPNYRYIKYALNAYASLDECLDVVGALPVGTKESLVESIATTDDEIATKKSCKETLLQGADSDTQAAVKCAEEEAELKDLKAERQKALDDLTQFTGFNFGYGLAFTYTQNDYIDDVDIRNGEVFVGKQRSHRGSFMLETHKFFQPKWLVNALNPQTGFGPFVAVSLADTEGGDPFSAYALGGMLGFKDREGSGSWNVGVGYYVNTEFKELRAGVFDGQATTEQNPNNLVVERDQGGLVVIVSATWGQ